jgi:hypothetical protein
LMNGGVVVGRGAPALLVGKSELLSQFHSQQK